MMLGPLARHPPRFEVLVVDRTTRRIVIRAPVDGPEAEATALGARSHAISKPSTSGDFSSVTVAPTVIARGSEDAW